MIIDKQLIRRTVSDRSMIKRSKTKGWLVKKMRSLARSIRPRICHAKHYFTYFGWREARRRSIRLRRGTRCEMTPHEKPGGWYRGGVVNIVKDGLPHQKQRRDEHNVTTRWFMCGALAVNRWKAYIKDIRPSRKCLFFFHTFASVGCKVE